MTARISQIKKLKLTCKKCETEFILRLDKSLFSCNVCGEHFNFDPMNDPFIRLRQSLEAMKEKPNYSFELICEEVQ